ncbi:MAG: hypothetical protein ACLPSW_13780 [Roseiarcus sp.]
MRTRVGGALAPSCLADGALRNAWAESYAMFGCARLRAALETMADFDIAKE